MGIGSLVANWIESWLSDRKQRVVINGKCSYINCAKLRADLRKLYNWSEVWQMLFNLDKCKIMHFEYNNPNNIFY